MSFRTVFLPSLLHRPSPSTFSSLPRNGLKFRSIHSPSSPFQRFIRSRQPADSRAIAISRNSPARRSISPLGLGIAASLALGSFSLAWPSRQVKCDSSFFSSSTTTSTHARLPSDPEPTSILSVYELSFGAVCGICAGVFVKKGARAIAFLLGGVFVLLQYLSTKSYISVDWARLTNKYDSAFSSRSSTGVSKSPTIGGVWNKFVDFLTSNFQQRASFLAGLALGLRLG